MTVAQRGCFRQAAWKDVTPGSRVRLTGLWKDRYGRNHKTKCFSADVNLQVIKKTEGNAAFDPRNGNDVIPGMYDLVEVIR